MARLVQCIIGVNKRTNQPGWGHDRQIGHVLYLDYWLTFRFTAQISGSKLVFSALLMRRVTMPSAGSTHNGDRWTNIPGRCSWWCWSRHRMLISHDKSIEIGFSMGGFLMEANSCVDEFWEEMNRAPYSKHLTRFAPLWSSRGCGMLCIDLCRSFCNEDCTVVTCLFASQI